MQFPCCTKLHYCFELGLEVYFKLDVARKCIWTEMYLNEMEEMEEMEESLSIINGKIRISNFQSKNGLGKKSIALK